MQATKPRETRFHKRVGFFFIIFFNLFVHVLMAVIHNSYSYFFCHQLFWGIVLYLG